MKVFPLCAALVVAACPVTAEQVFNENVIVGGGLCAGDFCQAGTSFPEGLLRLSTQSPRIHFNDASAVNQHEWQIRANEDSSSYLSMFSILDLTAATTPFTLFGGAPDNALWVDGHGLVGLGTSLPQQDLHIVASGNYPGIRLERTQAPAHSWDILADQTGFGIRDVTSNNKLPFFIASDAPPWAIWLDSAGYLGLVRLPDGRLDLAAALDPVATKRAGGPGPLAARLLAEDGRIDLSVLANDRDPDGDALTLDGFTQPAAGTVTQLLPLQVLRYTPNPDANGSDSFVYAVRDGRGGVASARVNLTIRPVNDAPVLGDDRFEMFAGNVLTADVLANDRDPEGEPLSGAGGTPPANGQAGLFPVDGRLMLRYQPNAGFTGDDTFAYRLRDPAGAVGSANVTVTVRPRLPSGQLRLVAGRFEDTGPSRSQTASLGNRVLTCALREQQDDGGIEARITDALTSVTGPGLRTLAWADGESGARCASVFVGEQPRASTPALAGLRLVDDRDGSVPPPRTTAPDPNGLK